MLTTTEKIKVLLKRNNMTAGELAEQTGPAKLIKQNETQ